MKKNKALKLMGISTLLVLSAATIVTIFSVKTDFKSEQEFSINESKFENIENNNFVNSRINDVNENQLGFNNPTKTALETEAAKFAVTMATNKEGIKTTTTARELSEPKPPYRLIRLREIVASFPTLSPGFSLLVNSAAVDAQTTTTINVSITITETSSNTKQTVEFKVTGLVAETSQAEMQRLADTLLVNKEVLIGKRKESAQVAAGKINTETLDIYYKPVELAKGISYVVKSATASADKVVVILTVSSTTAGVSPIDKTIEILNFITPLKLEASRFQLSLDSNIRTTTRQAIGRINSAQSNEDKVQAINDIAVGFPWTASDGFSFQVGEAQIDEEPTDSDETVYPTTIRILITVTELQTRTSQEVKTFIKYLTPETKQEEFERIVDSKLTSKPVPEDKKTETTLVAAKKINADTIESYYPRVDLGEGTTYTFKSFKAQSFYRRIDVTFIVNSNTFETFERTISITGFLSETTTETWAKTFEASPPSLDKTLKVTTLVRRLNDAETLEKKLDIIKSLVSRFPYQNNKFTMVIGKATIDPANPTTVAIPITVENKTPQHEYDVAVTAIYRITTLILETPQQELERLANETLINSSISGEKAKETALIAASKITEQTLTDYYPKITMPTGISYTLDSASASGNSLYLILKVTGDAGTNPYYKTVVISGFKSPTTALENEAARFGIIATATNGQTNKFIRKINALTTLDQKINLIKTVFPAFPTVDSKFTLEMGKAKQNKIERSSVDIPIKITQKVVPSGEPASINVTLIIKGMQYVELQEEFESIVNDLQSKSLLDSKKPLTALAGAKAITSKATLEEHVGAINFGETWISYEFQSAKAIALPNGYNRVKVTLKVSGGQEVNPIYKTFEIRGFADSEAPLEIEALKFAIELKAKDKTLLASKAVEQINAATNKVEAIKLIVDNFPDVTNTYQLAFEAAAINPYDPTVINMSITVSSKTDSSLSETVTFAITRLIA